MRHEMIIGAALLGALLLALWFGVAPNEAEEGLLRGSGARIQDGDTFDLVSLDATGQPAAVRVRLWGIDAPERGESGEDRAAFWLALLLTERGGDIVCARAAKRHQRAGPRVVATCWAGDRGSLSTSVNCRLIKEGVAIEVTRFSEGRLSTCLSLDPP